MAGLLAQWWRHPVTIARLLGSGPYGDTYAPETTHDGWIDDRRRLVRDATGTEVVSETTVLLPITTPDVPLNSTVTLPAAYGGRTTHVLAVSRHDGAGLPTPDHLELSLA